MGVQNKWFGYKIEQFGKRFDAAVTMEGGLVLNNILNYGNQDVIKREYQMKLQFK